MTFTERETINRNNIIEQINKVAEPFEDVNNILNNIDPEDDIVLLGECTHGTEEFYKIRADITKALVTKSRFRVIFIEAEWPDIYLINEYIHGKYPGMEVEQALSKIKNFWAHIHLLKDHLLVKDYYNLIFGMKNHQMIWLKNGIY